MKRLLLILLLLIGWGNLFARQAQDSVKIRFRQGYSQLELGFEGNRQALAQIVDSLRVRQDADSIYRLTRIEVIGGASPEGSLVMNRRLSQKRANKLFEYLSQYGELPDSMMTFTFLGRDWNGLLRLAEADPDLPYRDETLDFLRDIADRCRDGEKVEDNHVGRLSRFRDGVPYRYMYQHLFPELRTSRLCVWYERVWNPEKRPPICGEVSFPDPSLEPHAPPVVVRPYVEPSDEEEETQPEVQEEPKKPLYVALKNNMLYDALAVPNIGAEVYLGRNWSISGNWMYAWWKTDKHHWYWRTYGGDIAIRKWFGRKAKEKPLTGHHAGLYGQIITYDFETGGRGYLADKWSYAAGIEYGYSVPVGRRFNIDFSVGVGYMGGTYKKYLPDKECYVWQSTHQRHWFGPTKAEISLVWLIGRGNYNQK